ncbi:hypothetical protein ACLM5H_04940 [Fredinandcohnia humi]
MSLVEGLISVSDFVQALFPSSNILKQNVPLQPSSDSFVVRFQNERRESETRFHTVIERNFQVVYFNSDIQEVLRKMDSLSRMSLNKRIVIPIKDSLRYMRIESFSFSQPFETESELNAITGVLSVQVREARDQETYEKIMQVNSRIE